MNKQKEELLKEIEIALKKKVERKLNENSQIPQNQKPHQPKEYRSKDYVCKSPRNAMEKKSKQKENQSILELRKEKEMLERELDSFKMSISQLEYQSRELKREEAEFQQLRQENASLKK